MVGRRLGRILSLRRGADKKEEAGHFAGVERKILGAHVQADIDHIVGADRADQTRPHLRAERGIVHRHRVALGVRHLRHCGRTVRGGDVFGDIFQIGKYRLTHTFVEGADGADHFHLVGNDVVADAALDRAEGHHHRQFRDVLAAGNNRLRATDHIGGGDDRIHPAPRPRAVRLPALDDDIETVRRGHRRAGAVADLACVERAEYVQAEHCLGFEVAEDALLQHFFGAALLAVRGAFLGRLEHEQHFARQLRLHRDQRFGHAHQRRGMRVVAAGVHHAHGFAAKRRGDFRCERQGVAFGHRQRVHIRADRDARPGLAAFEHRDHSGGGDAGFYVESERAQVIGDEFGSARFAVAQFGVLMDIAAPCEDFRLQTLRLLHDFGALAVGGMRGRRAECACEGQGNQGRAHGVVSGSRHRCYRIHLLWEIPCRRASPKMFPLPVLRAGRGWRSRARGALRHALQLRWPLIRRCAPPSPRCARRRETSSML